MKLGEWFFWQWLVTMSPVCSVIDTRRMSIWRFSPFLLGCVYSWKWWYALFMCLFLSHNLGIHAISNAPEFPSKILHIFFGSGLVCIYVVLHLSNRFLSHFSRSYDVTKKKMISSSFQKYKYLLKNSSKP